MQKSRPTVNKSKQRTYDYLAKIVIIGNSVVGKTNLLLRFVNANYAMSHTPTIGVDFKSKIVQIKFGGKTDKKRLKLQLWDTAGQQRFRTLTQTYYNGASGIVIVYGIDDRKSFTDVKEWLYQLSEHKVQELPKIIIANKCDLKEERKVRFDEGRMLADQNSCIFMEVSAKENINVEAMFNQLSRVIMNDLDKENTSTKGNSKLIEHRKSNILINQSNIKSNTINKEQCCK